VYLGEGGAGERQRKKANRRGSHARPPGRLDVFRDAAAPSPALTEAPLAADPERRLDELWVALVARIDARLRAHYRVREFTEDPACILRLGQSPARQSVVLADGTRVRPGQPVGTLHFWNEHLPRYRAGGPDLRWAADIRRRLMRSLSALAEFVEADPAWQEVNAFCGVAALSSRLGVRQLHRVIDRYGFERVAPGPSPARRLYAIGECCVAWGLTRAFNPAALRRQPFFRPYHEMWISRARLLRLHARAGLEIAILDPAER
jgi:hypothetical protein